MSEQKAELSWRKADYLKAKAEVPGCLQNDENHSEGELMTGDDLAEWLLDTKITFSIIRKKDAVRFNELYRNNLLDLEYLTIIGKITKEDAIELSKLENFNF